MLELHADDPGRFDAALEALDGGVDVGSEPPPRGVARSSTTVGAWAT